MGIKLVPVSVCLVWKSENYADLDKVKRVFLCCLNTASDFCSPIEKSNINVVDSWLLTLINEPILH